MKKKTEEMSFYNDMPDAYDMVDMRHEIASLHQQRNILLALCILLGAAVIVQLAV